MKTQNRLSKLLITLTLLFSTSILCAEDAKPVGSIEIDESQVMALIGGTMGGGILTFDGASHKFNTGGLLLGASVGVQDIKVSGDVYHLTDVKDFPGVYFELEAGVTVVEGATGMWLKNKAGVTLHLTSSNEGLALQIGTEGLKISMK